MITIMTNAMLMPVKNMMFLFMILISKNHQLYCQNNYRIIVDRYGFYF
jgi:hypothetical protein